MLLWVENLQVGAREQVENLWLPVEFLRRVKAEVQKGPFVDAETKQR